VALLLGHPSWKGFAIGSSLGVASCLLSIFGGGEGALRFLITNALLCYGIAWLAMKGEQPA